MLIVAENRDIKLVESVAAELGCHSCRASIKSELATANISSVLRSAGLCVEHAKANGRQGGDIETYREVTSLHELLRYSVFSYLWFLEELPMPNTAGEQRLLSGN